MHERYGNVWILNSGCTNHMRGNKNLAANLDQYMKIAVKLGTERNVDVDGK